MLRFLPQNFRGSLLRNQLGNKKYQLCYLHQKLGSFSESTTQGIPDEKDGTTHFGFETVNESEKADKGIHFSL